MTSRKNTKIVFLDEGDRSPRPMEVSETLAMAVSRAAHVNANKMSPAISFDSLFIGLLATPDATGEWLHAQFERSGADRAALLRRCGLTGDQLDELVRVGPPAPIRSSPPDPPLTRTRSARQALEEAERRAHLASQVTDTAHVLAAMLSLPGFHDRDFREFGIDRRAWATALDKRLSPPVPAPAGAPLEFDPSAPGVEPHVASALKLANALAGSAPIRASHVAVAIVGLATSLNSAAFRRFAQLVPLPSDSTSVSPGALPNATRFEEELRRQLALAQRARPGGTERSPVWGRDLATAVLLCAAEKVGPVVTSAGRSLDTVRDLWYAFVTADSTHRRAEEWASWWREANVPLPEPRRAGYTTETDQGDDKLGVDAEARAFARLILDKDVQAPLSIGLLGDWGSGKSFFIEQIKQEIAALKSEGRPELHAEVVEIEFNAWHASDANLWASLVTTIFDEIWEKVAPADDTRSPAAARERLKRQIEQAKGALHEAEVQVQIGRQALELAELDLTNKREKLAWNHYVVSVTKTELRRVAKSAGWHQSIETINDVENAARSLAASGNRLRILAGALLEKPLLRIALPTGLLLVATAVAWLLVDAGELQPLTKWLTKLLATVAGAVGALAAPLTAATRTVRGFADTLERVHSEYESELANEGKKDSPEAKAEADAIARARRELESTEARVSAARTRLGELLNEQASRDPRRRLGAFLQERVQSTQYRSQQGIISLVHKDFRELSKYMRDLRESAAANAADSAEADIRPFDRIVLYVDDLDRCRPEHVVNMLEAVHLLLALDLFVVVVAVDSRWLTRALEVHYHDLLTATDEADGDGLRASTPQSYLEKIFQITYALGPMDPNRFGDYVAFLAGAEDSKPDGKSTAATGADASPTVAPIPSGTPGDQAPTEGRSGSIDLARGRTPRGDTSADRGLATTKRPPTQSVRIDKAERDLITRLVPLLPTPRIAKRFVNVYRVIKAGKTAEELDAFEREGRATTCLLMLAILFGRPGVAAELLRALNERQPPFDKPEERLIDALSRRTPAAKEPARVRDGWDELLRTLRSLKIDASVGDCAREPREVARYSLVSGHDWHTWSNPPAVTTSGMDRHSPTS